MPASPVERGVGCDHQGRNAASHSMRWRRICDAQLARHSVSTIQYSDGGRRGPPRCGVARVALEDYRRPGITARNRHTTPARGHPEACGRPAHCKDAAKRVGASRAAAPPHASSPQTCGTGHLCARGQAAATPGALTPHQTQEGRSCPPSAPDSSASATSSGRTAGAELGSSPAPLHGRSGAATSRGRSTGAGRPSSPTPAGNSAQKSDRLAAGCDPSSTAKGASGGCCHVAIAHSSQPWPNELRGQLYEVVDQGSRERHPKSGARGRVRVAGGSRGVAGAPWGRGGGSMGVAGGSRGGRGGVVRQRPDIWTLGHRDRLGTARVVRQFAAKSAVEARIQSRIGGADGELREDTDSRVPRLPRRSVHNPQHRDPRNTPVTTVLSHPNPQRRFGCELPRDPHPGLVTVLPTFPSHRLTTCSN